MAARDLAKHLDSLAGFVSGGGASSHLRESANLLRQFADLTGEPNEEEYLVPSVDDRMLAEDTFRAIEGMDGARMEVTAYISRMIAGARYAERVKVRADTVESLSKLVSSRNEVAGKLEKKAQECALALAEGMAKEAVIDWTRLARLEKDEACSATLVARAEACRMVGERIGAYRMSLVRLMKEAGE